MMYYMSFADSNKPTGEHFLGATIVKAEDPHTATKRAWELGINPGGEICFVAIPANEKEELPEVVQKYFETFVPREIAMLDPHETLGEIRAREAND